MLGDFWIAGIGGDNDGRPASAYLYEEDTFAYAQTAKDLLISTRCGKFWAQTVIQGLEKRRWDPGFEGSGMAGEADGRHDTYQSRSGTEIIVALRGSKGVYRVEHKGSRRVDDTI